MIPSIAEPPDYSGICPYIGVRAFRYEDRLLYTGRTDDIATCFGHLLENSVRVLVVHGTSGSGKSSFLQAGLLPHVNKRPPTRDDVGFKLLIRPDKIISVGPSIIGDLAKQIYQAIFTMDATYTLVTQQWLFDRFPDETTFSSAVTNNIGLLRDLMVHLSQDPRITWVISIDHTERIFEGNIDEQVKKNFFQLVHDFDDEIFNAKLVLVLRTERYGEFASALPEYRREVSFGSYRVNRLAHYFLGPPAPNTIIDIIKFPTQQGDKLFPFNFEDDLPEIIVNEILELAEVKNQSIELLPLIQAVCSSLYETAKERLKSNEKFTIFLTDYKNYKNHSKDFTARHIIQMYFERGINNALVPAAEDFLRERVRWTNKVLAHLAEFKNTTEITTSPLSEKKLLDYAREAYCSTDPIAVIQNLKQEPFSLLTTFNDKLVLQHDVLALAFKDNTIHEKSFMQQALDNEKARINEAAEYTADQLYGVSPLLKINFVAADLRFWDHKVIPFAITKKFFDRIGLYVEKTIQVPDNMPADDLKNRLIEGKPDTYGLFTYPRSLMNDEAKKHTTDVAILNAFTGYAIVAQGTTKIEAFKAWEPKKSFIQIFNNLRQEKEKVVLAEDKGAKDFFELLLDVHDSIRSSSASDLTNHVPEINIEINDTKVLSILSQQENFSVAVITAPAHAFLRELQFITLFDQNDMRSLLSIPGLDSEITRKLRSELVVHNSLNVSIPPSKAFDKQGNEELLLRLASVALFTVDYVRLNDKEVTDWICKNSVPDNPNDKPSKQAVKDIYRSSSHYFPTNSYPEVYFDPDSLYYFKNFGCSSEEHLGICDQIYFKLASLKQEYLRLAAEMVNTCENTDNEDFSKLTDQAYKHAKIYNFYDAVQFLKEAKQLLSKSDSE